MKIKMPSAAGKSWKLYGKPVTVFPDGTVNADADTIRILAERCPRFVEVVEGELPATEEPPEPVETAESENEAVSFESMEEGELRDLAKKHDVKLGRTKNRNKIIEKLRKAGVEE